MATRKRKFDCIVIGGGHNGLVAASYLGKGGKNVLLLEGKSVLGGACRTEYPFKSAPNVGASTGAYLVGPFSQRIISDLSLSIQLIRRDPHYFLPTRDDRYLLLGSNPDDNKRLFVKHFSLDDWEANVEMQEDLAMLRDSVYPSWFTRAPLSIEDTAAQYINELKYRQMYIDLCKGSVIDFLNRYSFRSELIRGMYAVTDGLIGAYGDFNSPGTGYNFLFHNMCNLPKSDGTWMLVKGGMGEIITELRKAALRNGVTIRDNSEVQSVKIDNGIAKGVILTNGEEISSPIVICCTDPHSMRKIVGDSNLHPSLVEQLNQFKLKPGATMKVNLCLNRLPSFTCLRSDNGQFKTTVHLLPKDNEVFSSIKDAFISTQNGELPKYPIIELYTHTVLDPSLQDNSGRHNAALFVQLVPNRIKNGSWADVSDDFVKNTLFKRVEEFAPDFSDCVDAHFTLTPEGIESHFGIRHGHILHVDPSFSHDARLRYEGEVSGLYFGSAACFPGGGVTGVPGYNVASVILQRIA